MIGLYKLVTSLAYVAAYPYARVRAGAGKELWRGRLGIIPSVGPKDIWLHAASVGEAKVVSFMVDYLVKRRSGITTHASIMTATGFKAATTLLPSSTTIAYFPLDAGRPVRKTFEQIRPRMVAVAETEIWPNFILTAAAQKIPVVLFNGRMSDSAFKRYRLIRSAMGPSMTGSALLSI